MPRLKASEPALLARVRDALKRQTPLPQQSRVIVGVSGGADSVALLHALCGLSKASRWRLIVGHVDHQLRPESQADAVFVQDLSRRLKLTCIVVSRDVRAVCTGEQLSLEDGARRVRYEAFQMIARQHAASHVVLAHTADDQAETVLLRLLRGSGLTGLAAIPWARPLAEARNSTDEPVSVLRPLLGCTRADVLEYLRAADLPHREDASNTDVQFTRNRVRHELLPAMEGYNPAIRAHLAQLAEQVRSDCELLDAVTDRYWKRVGRMQAGRLTLSLPALKRQPAAMQRLLVRRAIRLLQGDLRYFEYRHWEEVEQLFQDRPTGSVVSLPAGIRVERKGNQLHWFTD